MTAELEKVRLLTAISFHYVPARLGFLRSAMAEQPSLAAKVTLQVFTDASDAVALGEIESCLPPRSEAFDLKIVSVPFQSHPYFLTWAHKQALRIDFAENPGFTHFLYLEDDLRFTRENLSYWLSARELLRPHRLLPGFLRIEKDAASGAWVSTDLLRRVELRRTPVLVVNATRWFLNLRNPYQGMYLLDRELAFEHLAGPAMDPDFGPWGIRESAAQGQTFVDVPQGFRSRIVVPFDTSPLRISHECHVHHLPDNYANDDASPFGAVTLDDLVDRPTLSRLYVRWRSLLA